MTAKQYLEKIRSIDLTISTLLAEQSESEICGMGLSSQMDVTGIHGTGISNKVCNVSIKNATYDEMINAEKQKRLYAKKEAFGYIKKLENETQISILLKYYFQHKTFFEVANEINRSYQWTYEQYKRGLKELDKILEREGVK